MLIEILIAIFAGIFVGIFSGLTPGIHINMISLIVLSLSPMIINKISILPIGVFIIAMGVTHTFLDAIPSIFLGAPDDNTALGVLPGHRYLLRGNGMMAVKLFTIGSLFGLIGAIIIFPLLYIITKYSYHFFEYFFAYILISVILFMIWKDKHKLWAISVIIASSILGMIVFNLNLKDPLFPLLSGLFGISTLIISFFDSNNIPEQQDLDYTLIDNTSTLKSMIAGNFSSFIVSTFPGLSSSIAAVLSMQFIKDLGDKGFMIITGCIGTSSFILSLVALYTINKARNGAVIVISKLMEIDIMTIIIFLQTSLIAAGISTILSLLVGKIFARTITKVNYKILLTTIIIFVTFMVYVMTSWIGLLVLVTSTAIGIIPGIVKIQRSHSMACLIVPVIVYLL